MKMMSNTSMEVTIEGPFTLSPGALSKPKQSPKTKKLLEFALSDSYNAENELQCKISVNKWNHSELEIILKLTNIGCRSIRTPLSQPWKSNFALLVFDEDTCEYITTITDGEPRYEGEDILLAPGQSMRTSFRDVLSKIDAGNLKDVMFVVTNLPSSKIAWHFARTLIETEVDPFCFKFWTDTLWRNEVPWDGSSFVSNVLRTSIEFPAS